MPDNRIYGITEIKVVKRTPVISFASTKGGVGKTTLAMSLATALANRLSGSAEYRIACIDADPNATLDTALRQTGFPEILSMVSDAETLLPTLRDAQRSADLVLIDLEGSANQSMLYAAGKSDLVIIPAQPSAFDVREARKTAGVVQQAADLVQREIPITVVLTRTPVLRQRVADHSRTQFSKADLPLLSVELVQRTAFQTMTYTGQPPFLTEPGGGAAQNVDALADAIAELIGLELHARAPRGDA
jgi:chromosome partitioning protein